MKEGQLLPIALRAGKFVAAASAGLASLALAGPAIAAPAVARAHASHQATAQQAAKPRYHVRQILNGMTLHHTYVPAGSSTPKSDPLTGPDDITVLGHHLFTAFQNGVGPQGEASTDGNTDSTVVEFTASGKVIGKWNIKGKCDGLTADAGRGFVIATVNEDANSSIYTIRPGAPAGREVRHYHYSEPLPHFGGTDAISIYRGQVFISASAPGTTGTAAPQPTYPAVYSVVFHRHTHVAAVTPLYSDEADATVANLGADHGKTVQLALTDADSNEVVPGSAPRFAGDFMLTSQGDQEQIFAHFDGWPASAQNVRLSVLRLSQAVDDTAWARGQSGRLYGTDASADTVDVVTGHFWPGSIFVAVTPCDAADAPATCPGPGFPANYLGSVDPWTGTITTVPLAGPAFQPKGLVFVGRHWQVTPG
jgi:hypothetical protein